MKKRVVSMLLASVLMTVGMTEPIIAMESESSVPTTIYEEFDESEDVVLEYESEQISSDVDVSNGENEISLLDLEVNEPKATAYEVGSGKFKVEITGISKDEDISEVCVPTWSSDDQSDMYWYIAEKQEDGSYLVEGQIANHKYHLGYYTSHVYTRGLDGSLTLVAKTSVILNDISAGNLYEAVSANQSVKKLVLDSVEDQGLASKVYFVVWSDKGGQDDVVWYDATVDGNTYLADIPLYNHRDIGLYHVHVYISGKDWQMRLLKTSIFEVSELPESEMKITDMEKNKDGFEASIFVNQSNDNVSNAYVEVWTKSDKSDLHEYEASIQSDGTYRAQIGIQNHGYYIGEYNVKCYVEDIHGELIYNDSLVHTVEFQEGELTANIDSQGYSTKLLLSGATTQGIASQVYFVVWSEQDGQDDVVWYEATQQGDTYFTDMYYYNHNDVGLYNVHVYISGKDWKMHFLQKTTFEVLSIPESEIKVVGTDDMNGTFDVNMYINRPHDSVSNVYLASWTESDQSDIYWYDAQLQNDGTYSVKVNIKNHGYHVNKYNLQCYVKDKEGKMVLVDSLTHTLEMKAGAMQTVKNAEGYSMQLTLADVKDYGIASKVYFVVWSQQNGQDDMVWYDATVDGNTYSANVLLCNHKDTGVYNVHVYVSGKDWKMHLLKADVFTVDELPEEGVQITDINQREGTFNVNIYLSQRDDIQMLRVPVWTKSDQSDIYWYTAYRRDDGGYEATVDANNHQWHSGVYKIHTYALTNEGKQEFVDATSLELQLDIGVRVEVIDNYSTRISVYGIRKDALNVRFPAWSIENGQDDIVWYNGQKNSDGSWQVEVHSKNHSNAGEYVCHVYVDTDVSSDNVAQTEFNIADKSKAGWQWIGGYKRYINEDGEIDNDVSRLVSGPYLIKVYKWSNYLIVFAKDENGEYRVPVKAMVTSCGNATPTGTYYSPRKYRWLTMVGGSKAQWCTQIIGDFLFHSVPYRVADPTTLYTDRMYNYLGTTQSLGCIRLQAGDAKWIYDNCELGTQIFITPHESEGPIAKPGFTPVPSWHTWDPTDPNVQYLCHQHGCH